MEEDKNEVVKSSDFYLEELESFSDFPSVPKRKITDPMILSKVDNLVTTAGKGLVSTVQNQQSLKGLYKVTIHSGGKLMETSKGTVGTVLKNGKIVEQAILTEVGTDAISAINPVSAVFEIASMVTAQHYMAEIEQELKNINNKLDVLVNFHKSEVVVNLKVLSQEIENLSKYSSENMLDESTKNIKRQSIENHRVQVNREFQKANDFLNQNVEYLNSKNMKIREQHIEEFDFWLQVQKFSLSLLEELAKLEFQYGRKTAASRRQAFSIYEKNVDKAQLLISTITAYSEYNSGLNTFFHRGKEKRINEKVNLPIQRFQKIKYKKYDSEALLIAENKDIELILEDGKVYYLPEEE